jgi:hypothetical protein
VVVCGDPRRCETLLADSAWVNVKTRQTVGESGSHEGAGGFALAAAAVLISKGHAAEVLALAHGAQQVRWSLFCQPTY